MVKTFDVMTCVLCGEPMLRRSSWWARLIGLTPPPTHDPTGPDALACWRGFRTRLGLDPDVPMPGRQI